MKKTSCLLLKALFLFLTFQLSQASLAQPTTFGQQSNSTNKNTNESQTSVKLSDILKEFKKKLGVDILFEDKVVEGIIVNGVAINIDESIEKNLENILKLLPLNYKKVKENTYLIIAVKRNTKNLNTPIVDESKTKTVNQFVPNGNPNDIQIASANNGALSLLPDNIIITGTVKDEAGKPIEGVTVTELGTKNSVVTDAKGTYKIKVQDDKAKLTFSSIGFNDQIAVIGNKKKIDISLKDAVKTLEDVVVIGYGAVKKTDATGSVASIKATDLQGLQLNNLQEALQGRVAGLQLITNDATPGSAPSIRIRGTSSLGTSSEPLFVIDGYPSSESLNTINPNDIESIEVLKDGSATAIYGSRGANGVILVTTKKGKAGTFNVNFDLYTGVADISKKLNLMNARQYAEYRNELLSYLTPTRKPFASPALLDYYSTHSENWEKALFNSAPITSANISINGGDDKSRYSISSSYFDQGGVLVNTGFKRGTLRFNYDRTLNKKLKFNIIANFARTSTNGTLINTTGGTAGGVVIGALRANPTIPVYDSLGNFTVKNGFITDVDSDPNPTVEDIGNPVAYAKKSIFNNDLLRGQVNTSLEYEIISGLKLKSMVGVEYNNNWRNTYIPNDLYEQIFLNGSASKNTNIRYNWINENYLTYSKKLSDKNSIDALLGTSFQVFKAEVTSTNATNFFTNTFSFNNLGAATSVTASSGASKNQLASFFGRVNLKLLNKFLLTASLRADGSSKFGENNKYGYFPSGAVAYRLIEESFIRKIKAINDLKLRISYAITGNQEIAPYLSQFGYGLASNLATLGINSAAGRATFGNTNQTSVAATRPANPNLKWEQTSSFNIGIDAAFFNRRLSFTADYYTKVTRDLLWDVKLQAVTGYNTTFQNLGQLNNKGFELNITAIPVQTQNFKWSSTATFAKNVNKIIDIGIEGERPYGSQLGVQGGALTSSNPNFILIKPGLSVGAFYGFVADGIWQSQDEIDKSAFTTAYKALQVPGGVKYKDLNGDGNISIAGDRDLIGSAYPDYTFGFINSFSYKDFEVSIFLQGQTGSKVLNLNKLYTEYTVGANKAGYLVDRWKGEGTSNSLPRAGLENTRLLDNTLIEDASFLRIQSVQIGYNLFPKSKFLKSLKFKSIRFYATGTNLVTFTKYTGYDPEVGSFNNNLFAPGIDFGAYPRARSVIFGLKLGL